MAIVLLTDELNRSGFRILPKGGKLDGYSKNPLLLFMHSRPSRWDRDNLPIGRIENVRIENGKLIGDDPIFDEEDEFALKCKKKFEKGFLNAFSVGIDPEAISEEAEYLIQGQTRPTVTSWELLEISLVDIPNYKNAVRMSKNGTDNLDEILPKLEPIQNKLEMNQKEIALSLGLSENATEAEIKAKIEQNKQDAANAKSQAIEALIQMGRGKGLINDGNEKEWKSMAQTNYDSAKTIIQNHQGATEQKDDKPSTQKGQEAVTVEKVLQMAGKTSSQKGKDDRSEWTFEDWEKKDSQGLLKMKREEPEKYEELASNYLPDYAQHG